MSRVESRHLAQMEEGARREVGYGVEDRSPGTVIAGGAKYSSTAGRRSAWYREIGGVIMGRIWTRGSSRAGEGWKFFASQLLEAEERELGRRGSVQLVVRC